MAEIVIFPSWSEGEGKDPQIEIRKKRVELKDRITYFSVETAYESSSSEFESRFSEFVEFRDKLEGLMPLANQLPPFPPKTFKLINTKHLTPEFVDNRIALLHVFFRNLWKVPLIRAYPFVYEFYRVSTEGAERQKLAYEELKRANECPFKLSVEGYNTIGEGKNAVTYYHIHRACDGVDEIVLKKRFSEIKALHDNLVSDYKKNSRHILKNFPVFPNISLKFLIDHNSPDFVDSRRETLDTYFRTITNLPHMNVDIHLLKFLELWEGW